MIFKVITLSLYDSSPNFWLWLDGGIRLKVRCFSSESPYPKEYKVKWTIPEQEVFSLLCCKVGVKLSQREIAKILGFSPTTISKAIENLKEKNIVKVEELKNTNLISFNRDEEKAIELKRIKNLNNMYLSGLSNYLFNNLPGGVIIIFGSYSKGEDTQNSDIDIAVVGRKDKVLHLEDYEKILERSININFYDSWKKINKNLKNNILNGFVLHGCVDL